MTKLQRFIPQTPDPYLKRADQLGAVKFGHINALVDSINSTIYGDYLQLAGDGPMSTTLRALEDPEGNIANLYLATNKTAISGPLKIGNSDANTGSAILQIDSTSQGVLFPRMTIEERDNIVSPAIGLLIYNSEDSQLNAWDGAEWAEIGGGGVYEEGTGLFSTQRTNVNNIASANHSASLGGQNNCAAGIFSIVGGGCANNALGTYSSVFGGLSNCANNDYGSVLGGFKNETYKTYGTVVNGACNYNSSTNPFNLSTISGGYLNYNNGSLNYIGAGIGNKIFNGACNSIVGGENNCITADTANGSNFIGGGRFNKLCTNSFRNSIVGGWGHIIINSQDSFIGGGALNLISAPLGASTIAGGDFNCTSGNYSFIGGGCRNSGDSTYSTISGGESNTTSTGTHATVVGGQSNVSSGQHSISGGNGNTASGISSVALGNSNTAGGNITFAGGYLNTTGGAGSVALGWDNQATANFSTALGERSRASSAYSAVLGGSGNTASTGSHATVVGGESNTSSGSHSISGGNSNTASGARAVSLGVYSIASGNESIAIGQSNRSSGQQSVSLGWDNISSATYSFSQGRNASAYLWGQSSIASGSFDSSKGPAQASTLIARKQAGLTTAQTTILSLDGTGVTSLIIPEGNRAWNAKVETIAVVIGITGTVDGVSVGDALMQDDTVLFTRVVGTSSVIGVNNTNIIASTSMGTSSMSYSAGASQELAIAFNAPTFTGGGSVTVRVVSKVSLVEVAW